MGIAPDILATGLPEGLAVLDEDGDSERGKPRSKGNSGGRWDVRFSHAEVDSRSDRKSQRVGDVPEVYEMT